VEPCIVLRREVNGPVVCSASWVELVPTGNGPHGPCVAMSCATAAHAAARAVWLHRNPAFPHLGPADPSFSHENIVAILIINAASYDQFHESISSRSSWRPTSPCHSYPELSDDHCQCFCTR
jgi:hypothetical protein